MGNNTLPHCKEFVVGIQNDNGLPSADRPLVLQSLGQNFQRVLVTVIKTNVKRLTLRNVAARKY
jgi:hypothetical protein